MPQVSASTVASLAWVAHEPEHAAGGRVGRSRRLITFAIHGTESEPIRNGTRGLSRPGGAPSCTTPDTGRGRSSASQSDHRPPRELLARTTAQAERVQDGLEVSHGVGAQVGDAVVVEGGGRAVAGPVDQMSSHIVQCGQERDEHGGCGGCAVHEQHGCARAALHEGGSVREGRLATCRVRRAGCPGARVVGVFAGGVDGGAGFGDGRLSHVGKGSRVRLLTLQAEQAGPPREAGRRLRGDAVGEDQATTAVTVAVRS
ncbi:hypothetical protein C8D88_104136 [Lentzea atacamensis]|uniref:Uncharacterized protein n=1 Tax=Lentzea atacamensis TaxID=531938 RepID=A0A316I1G7_9PSEU|nr:hypothetical protein C8D88_104136 [Lentzea atacamensis]